MIDLPGDGVVTRAVFDALPTLSRGWAWQLRGGRLELVYRPVTAGHWQLLTRILGYWQELGFEAAGDQYVAETALARGGEGRNLVVAGGVVFASGHRLKPDATIHDAADVYVVVEGVSGRRQEDDALAKLGTYAALAVARYWIVRGVSESDDVDGMVSMYELREGVYELSEHRLVSRLSPAATP